MSYDFTLQMTDENPLDLAMGDNEELNLGLGESYIMNKNYNVLINKPQINGVELQGNKTTRELGIEITDPMTDQEIEEVISGVFNE